MFKRIYVEITNQCNLACSFCPGTRRAPGRMTAAQFASLLPELRSHTGYLMLHVMGEPLLHPELEEILALCRQYGLRVCLTTNGTLLSARRELLCRAPALHKLSVSLHSMEGNGLSRQLTEYLQQVWDTAEVLRRQGVLCCLRLWNQGGAEEWNEEILAFLHRCCPQVWQRQSNGSFLLQERLYLEPAEYFDWPDLAAPPQGSQFCHALRQQIAVLWDGTVVPCCLDHEGDIPLGNLFTQSLEEILSSPRAEALYDGFSRRQPSEELCRRCGYATRFNR